MKEMKETKEIEWVIILQKPEFYEFLPNIDIIELSLVNNLIRKKLKSYIFSKFNVAKYFNIEHRVRIEEELNELNEEDKLLAEPKLIDQYSVEFKQSFHNLPHKQLIKKLKYNETIPVDFINIMLLEVFPNLKKLEFTRVRVPFHSILTIFANLKKLENLNLDLTRIIRYKNESYTASDLIFPQSLTSLKFRELGLEISQPMNYLKDLDCDVIGDFEDMIVIGICPQYLPNLQHFYYSPKLPASPETTRSFLDFLKLNKNIVSLETLPRFFTQEIIQEVSNNIKLTKLKLGLFLRNSRILDTSITYLKSITNLSLHLDSSTIAPVNNICKLFPNISVLTLNCYYSSNNLFQKIFNNFPKLTQLTLKSYAGVYTKIFNTINLPELKVIRFQSQHYYQYELNDFNNLPNLRRIIIEWEILQGSDNKLILENFNSKNWKIYNNNNRIQCYKFIN